MKRYASIIRIISVVELLGGILAGVTFALKFDNFLTLVYFVAGASLAFVFSASYANLLETTDDTNEMLHRIMEQGEIAQIKKTTLTDTSVKSITKAITDATIPNVQRNEEKAIATKDLDDPAYIVCSQCRTKQKANREVCFNCGAKFQS